MQDGRFAQGRLPDGDYMKHIDILDPLLPFIRQGVSVDDLATGLAIDSPSTTQSGWQVRIRAWLRTLPPNDPVLQSEVRKRAADKRRLEVSKIFKVSYDVPGINAEVVGAELSDTVRHHPRSRVWLIDSFHTGLRLSQYIIASGESEPLASGSYPTSSNRRSPFALRKTRQIGWAQRMRQTRHRSGRLSRQQLAAAKLIPA